MAIRETGSVRALALVGPTSSGKTALMEALLEAATGHPVRPGEVGDSSPEAKARGHSVELNLAGFEFMNDRYVVVLTVTPTNLGSGQYVVADPLPAGFEIENPNLLQGSGVADLSWLTVDQPVHFEARTDQYVAAFRFTEQAATVTTAYLVRAVTPGTFVLPGATVEDMYRPELRGNTDAGEIEVSAVGP